MTQDILFGLITEAYRQLRVLAGTYNNIIDMEQSEIYRALRVNLESALALFAQPEVEPSPVVGPPDSGTEPSSAPDSIPTAA